MSKNYIELGIQAIIDTKLCTPEQEHLLQDESLLNAFEHHYDQYLTCVIEEHAEDNMIYTIKDNTLEKDIGRDFDFLLQKVVEFTCTQNDGLAVELFLAKTAMILEKAIEKFCGSLKLL